MGFGARRKSRAEKWPWLKKLLKKPSIMRVFWVRQLMVPGLVLNVLLGMTPVRHSRFLLGTALGYLPLNVAFSLVGSGLGKGQPGLHLRAAPRRDGGDQHCGVAGLSCDEEAACCVASKRVWPKVLLTHVND
jgi:hypothetical protein